MIEERNWNFHHSTEVLPSSDIYLFTHRFKFSSCRVPLLVANTQVFNLKHMLYLSSFTPPPAPPQNSEPVGILAVQINDLVPQSRFLHRPFEIRQRGEEDVVVTGRLNRIVTKSASCCGGGGTHEGDNKPSYRYANKDTQIHKQRHTVMQSCTMICHLSHHPSRSSRDSLTPQKTHLTRLKTHRTRPKPHLTASPVSKLVDTAETHQPVSTRLKTHRTPPTPQQKEKRKEKTSKLTHNGSEWSDRARSSAPARPPAPRPW